MIKQTFHQEETDINLKYFYFKITPQTQQLKSKQDQMISLVSKAMLQTAHAIEESRYKSFDALIKNFGCQLTALELQQKLRQKELREIAKIIQKISKESFKEMKELKFYLDHEAMSSFCKLTRFYILSIINANKVVGLDKNEPREMAVSKIEALYNFCEKQLSKSTLNNFIEALQTEESISAAEFIRQCVAKTPPFERKELLSQALNLQEIVDKIAFTPLMYNAEASLKTLNGVILFKNKTQYCNGSPTPNPLKAHVAYKMPENEILSEDQLREFPESEPLFVIEGYVKSSSLIKILDTFKPLAVVTANAAILPQIKNLDSLLFSRLLKDDIKNHQNLLITAQFEIDHVYCASKKEEGL